MSVQLKHIVAAVQQAQLHGEDSVIVTGVTHDSRRVKPGWLFVALPGAATDGHKFVADAVNSGAAAVVAKHQPSSLPETMPWIKVPDARKALGTIAAVVYGYPTRDLTLVGITGTNGKTTLTFLLEAIVRAAGGCPGIVGTISYRWPGKEQSALHTTPEASDLQALFRDMVDARVTHAVIEASSHGLELGRLEGCDFDLGVFTNLSQDHLDFHGTMEAYYQSKRILFRDLLVRSAKKRTAAAINQDDPQGATLIREIEKVPVLSYGLTTGCDVTAEQVSLGAAGLSARVKTPSGAFSLNSRLTGSFNLSNILAAVAVSEALGIPHGAVQEGVQAVSVVPGRMERVPSDRGTILVDYAHTPQALANALTALQGLSKGRIVTVMGCGGDRDKSKRPVMGKEAAAASDVVVVTSDNPRTEDPLAIIEQVVEGVRGHGFELITTAAGNDPVKTGSFLVIPDRRKAIAWAVSNIKNGDILLIAGKGHETYQEINGVRYPFDDREVVREELDRIASVSPRTDSGKKSAGRSTYTGDRDRT
ncbi:MAG: UDP-N-acetylmuramoyl-L-alanyl-D-glutamate--2,6-diaminopimelate ligase [Thermodesulfobacteriota bacterium]